MSARRSLVLGVLLGGGLGSLLAGCPDSDRGFGDGGRVDDDSQADDDSDTPQPPQAPTLVITALLDGNGDPVSPPIAGPLRLVFEINDPDSSQYYVTASFGTGGTAGQLFPATLSNATNPPSEFSEVVVDAPPIDFHTNSILWDTVTDIPTATETAVIQLCPRDGEGNEGECVLYPADGNLVVENTLESGLGAFCEPGHMEDMNWLLGRAIVPLSDDTCFNYKESNPPQADDFSAQFMVVMVNPNPDPVRFRVIDSETPNGGGLPPQRSGVLRAAPRRAAAPVPAPPPVPCGPFPPTLTDADLHQDEIAPGLLYDVTMPRQVQGAVLEALGDHVAVYVDEETPMDWDADCNDPSNPIEPHFVPAFGFTNCDIEQVVDVLDWNVYPTVTGLYGEPSDVDQNGRVIVVISLRVNHLTEASPETDDDSFIVKSYAQPEIDLWTYDEIVNPDSNQGEIIYMFAPDPYELWSGVQVPIAEYLSYELAGRFAVALQDIISYGRHRGICDAPLDPTDPNDLSTTPAEADWLNDGLGLLAADLSGFGATAYTDAWIYLDRPNLLPLTAENDLLSFQDRGGQYLFARYLFDLYGPAVLTALVDGTTVGADSVAAVVAADATGFEDFALQWAAAMAVSGRPNPLSPGNLLVPDSELPNYKVSTQIVVSSPPLVGELFGANGYQIGFNIRGDNRVFTDGTNPGGGTELSALTVRTENLDPTLFHPQTDYFGQVAGDFGVTAMLVSGLDQETNYLIIQTEEGHDLLGTVVRIEDTLPTNPRLTLEDVFGAIPTTTRPLFDPLFSLDPNGAERNVIGVIGEPQAVSLMPASDPPEAGDDDDDTTAAAAGDDDSAVTPISEEIVDTDRFGFTLTSAAGVGIWIDRRLSSITGEAALQDPFVAVARASDVPDAFDYPSWNAGPAGFVCSDPGFYLYPSTFPSFVAAQGNLIPDPEVSESSEFFPIAGAASSTIDCAYDFDQDGIYDIDEAIPTNLAEQILQRQAENLADDPATYEDTFELLPAPYNSVPIDQPWFNEDFIDLDSNEFPDDELATAFLPYNIGGRAVEGGEEAVWAGMLPPGDYEIIVGGANNSEGPYDLSVRILLQ